MIFDRIDQLSRYDLPFKEEIIAFLKSQDLKTIADGEYEIDGRNLFVRAMGYSPKPAAEKDFETHAVYADLQYVVEGEELMQLAPTDQLKPTTEYDADRDIQFFKAADAVTDIVVRAGEFAVFYPGEAHKPACLYKEGQKNRKLVFKIKMA